MSQLKKLVLLLACVMVFCMLEAKLVLKEKKKVIVETISKA
jgi:hypothetical protein